MFESAEDKALSKNRVLHPTGPRRKPYQPDQMTGVQKAIQAGLMLATLVGWRVLDRGQNPVETAKHDVSATAGVSQSVIEATVGGIFDKDRDETADQETAAKIFATWPESAFITATAVGEKDDNGVVRPPNMRRRPVPDLERPGGGEDNGSGEILGRVPVGQEFKVLIAFGTSQDKPQLPIRNTRWVFYENPEKPGQFVFSLATLFHSADSRFASVPPLDLEKLRNNK